MLEFTDVTLRDGLQLVPAVPVQKKFELFKWLVECGYSRLEITSFVHPKVVQFQDADALCKKIFARKSAWPPLMAFAPNVRGAARLLAYPIDWVACFVAASEAFSQRNVNASIDQSLLQVEAIISETRNRRRQVRVYISTVFGCPYEGPVDEATLIRVLRTVASLEPDEIALGDTIGVATPQQVRRLLLQIQEFFPLGRIALHLHNTYGLATACALQAWSLGVRKFDGSTGGIGGCPYAKGASGNVASEDLLYAFCREQAWPDFRVKEINRVLQYLTRTLKLGASGHLAEVWQKGGAWYGV